MKSVVSQAMIAAAVCMVFVLLWVLPVAIMGYTPDLFTPLLHARNFAATGQFMYLDELGRILSTDLLPTLGQPSTLDGRLSSVVYGLISQSVSLSDSVTWALVGSVYMAIALWFMWLAVYKVLSPRIAWISLIISALLPVYFWSAIYLDFYNVAFVFLFASMAAYVWLRERSEWWALVVSGVLFGAAIAAKDVFLVFLPWYVVSYLWQGRRQWLVTSVQTGLFLVCAGVMYLSPYYGDIVQLGYPVNQNLAKLWPGAADLANESYLHLYPDPYTYHFAKEEFDTAFIAEFEGKPLLQRIRQEKVMLGYGLSSGMWRRLQLGTVLLFESIPPFFHRTNTGGVFLWLFVIPGAYLLWQKHRNVLWNMLGLTASMYLVIRFVLLYERDHFINIAWLFGVLVASGMTAVLHSLELQRGWRKPWFITTGVVLIVALQLLQANRYELAYRYSRSQVPETLALASMLQELPQDAVVMLDIHPSRVERVAALSDRTVVLVNTDTYIQHPDVIERYNITHAVGYDVPITGVAEQALPTATSPEASAWLRGLLNIIR